MKPETASWLRKFFLVLVIAADVLMLASWWLGGHVTFFFVFVGINICVLAGEVVNSLFVYKKTLSTQVTKAVEQGGGKALFSYAAVILLVLTMIFLGFHLLIHAKPPVSRETILVV